MKGKHDYLSEALADCADMLSTGASVSSCLERYPDQAAELKGLLETVARVAVLRPVPPRDPAVVDARLSQFTRAAYQVHLSHNEKMRAAAAITTTSWLQRVATRLSSFLQGSGSRKLVPIPVIAYLLLIVFTGILATGAVTASAAAIPGDLLYSVKVATEKAQLALTLDPLARSELEKAFQERREQEVTAVLERRRNVTLPLSGGIEQLGSDWLKVAGRRITLTSDTLVDGLLGVGAQVEGSVRAPGDGTLVAVWVEVTVDAPLPVTSAPSPAPLVATPARRATVAPTTTPVPVIDVSPTEEVLAVPIAPVIATQEPAEAPAFTSTPVPTAAPTQPPAPTPTEAPSSTPEGSETITRVLIGQLIASEGSRWVVDDEWFETDGGTQIGGKPETGARVQVTLVDRPGLLPLARQIVVLSPPMRRPFAMTGTVLRTGSVWLLGFNDGSSRTFRVTRETRFPNGPAGVGDEATVVGEERAGDLYALVITRIGCQETFVEGPIEAINDGSWVINDTTVIVTSDTRIHGTPAIDAWARANGCISPDGSQVIATDIYIE